MVLVGEFTTKFNLSTTGAYTRSYVALSRFFTMSAFIIIITFVSSYEHQCNSHPHTHTGVHLTVYWWWLWLCLCLHGARFLNVSAWVCVFLCFCVCVLSVSCVQKFQRGREWASTNREPSISTVHKRKLHFRPNKRVQCGIVNNATYIIDCMNFSPIYIVHRSELPCIYGMRLWLFKMPSESNAWREFWKTVEVLKCLHDASNLMLPSGCLSISFIYKNCGRTKSVAFYSPVYYLNTSWLWKWFAQTIVNI